jgi:hypothetical protein
MGPGGGRQRPPGAEGDSTPPRHGVDRFRCCGRDRDRGGCRPGVHGRRLAYHVQLVARCGEQLGASRARPEGIPNELGTGLRRRRALSAATPSTASRARHPSRSRTTSTPTWAAYVDAAPHPIPLGVVRPVVQQTATGRFASATNCCSWLHTDVQDGVIHSESPTRTTHTLGQFFDEWNQPLSTGQVASSSGTVTAYVNGKRYTGDPRTIPLLAHGVIQLDVGLRAWHRWRSTGRPPRCSHERRTAAQSAGVRLTRRQRRPAARGSRRRGRHAAPSR